MFAKKYSLQSALVLPVACLVAFSGCSSIEGTADSRPAMNSKVSIYMQANQEPAADNSDEDPGYEWFY
jgi:uncharacterized protein YceK